MSIRDDITRIFTRVSKSSNIRAGVPKHSSYISLFKRNDTNVSYATGMSILRDTQVATGFEILKYLLSSKKWILTNTEEDSEIYDFILEMLQNMETELNTTVKQMASAMLWGFSAHEKMYDVVDGKIVVKDHIPIHIKTLQQKPFTYDPENGDLIELHQVTQNGEADIPISKILLYSYNSLYDEYEGHGLLFDFLPIVEDKENLMNWLMTFAEKNGSPTLYGKTDNEASRDELLAAFEDVSEGTVGLTLGPNDEVGVLESSHKGETYFSTLQYKDNQIFRRMFIGNLLMGDNSQTGTYAQSQTQLEFGSMVFDGILEEIANAIQKQTINPVVEFNWGPERKAPIISFDKFSSGDLKKLFDIIKPLMDTGVIDSENSAVQESLALLFKSEAGVEYVNEEPEMPEEDFNIEPVSGETLTTDILTELLP